MPQKKATSAVEPNNPAEEAPDQVAEAIRYAARELGTGDAATSMGAIEFLGSQVNETGNQLSGSVDRVAEALASIAVAIQNLADNIGGDGLSDIADSLDGISSAVKHKDRGTPPTPKPGPNA
jgi:hypothetical protein